MVGVRFARLFRLLPAVPSLISVDALLGISVVCEPMTAETFTNGLGHKKAQVAPVSAIVCAILCARPGLLSAFRRGDRDKAEAASPVQAAAALFFSENR